MHDPKAPKHLSPASRRWWLQIIKTHELGADRLRILTLVCEAWDRLTQAREDLRVNGLTFVDRFGQPRPRPCVAIERDSRIAVARLLRELRLGPARQPDDDGADEEIDQFLRPPADFQRRISPD